MVGAWAFALSIRDAVEPSKDPPRSTPLRALPSDLNALQTRPTWAPRLGYPAAGEGDARVCPVERPR